MPHIVTSSQVDTYQNLANDTPVIPKGPIDYVIILIKYILKRIHDTIWSKIPTKTDIIKQPNPLKDVPITNTTSAVDVEDVDVDVDIDIRKIKGVRRSIRDGNINTCYMNTAMAVIASSKVLRKALEAGLENIQSSIKERKNTSNADQKKLQLVRSSASRTINELLESMDEKTTPTDLTTVVNRCKSELDKIQYSTGTSNEDLLTLYHKATILSFATDLINSMEDKSALSGDLGQKLHKLHSTLQTFPPWKAKKIGSNGQMGSPSEVIRLLLETAEVDEQIWQVEEKTFYIGEGIEDGSYFLNCPIIREIGNKGLNQAPSIKINLKSTQDIQDGLNEQIPLENKITRPIEKDQFCKMDALPGQKTAVENISIISSELKLLTIAINQQAYPSGLSKPDLEIFIKKQRRDLTSSFRDPSMKAIVKNMSPKEILQNTQLSKPKLSKINPAIVINEQKFHVKSVTAYTGAHWTTYLYNRNTGTWSHYNDDDITPLDNIKTYETLGTIQEIRYEKS